MSLDSAFIIVGEFGKYQRKIFILLCLVGFPAAIFEHGSIFWMQTPDFTCNNIDTDTMDSIANAWEGIAESIDNNHAHRNKSKSETTHDEVKGLKHSVRYKYWNYLWQNPKLSACYMSTHEDRIHVNNHTVDFTYTGGDYFVDSGLWNGSCPHVVFHTDDVTFVTVVTRVSNI